MSRRNLAGFADLRTPVLQEILGHASIVTTQRYARLSEVHVKAEAERIRDEFGKVLGRSSTKVLALN